MSLRKVQLGLSVLALSFSPPSHAGEVFEPQVLKIGEACAGRTSIILNGKNICEVPNSKNEVIEVSQDEGKTWKTLGLGGMIALDLALGLGLLVRSRQKVSQDSEINPNGREPQKLPVLTERIDDANTDNKISKHSIIEMFKRVGIEGHTESKFIKDNELNIEFINFSHENRFFQIGMNGVGELYFHWFKEKSETMNSRGEWKVTTPDFGVSLGMIENFLDVIKMFPIQERE